MTTRYSSLALGLLLIVNLATASIDHEVLVRDAISRIHWDFQTEWAFNETTEEDGIVTVGRFDPSADAGDRWQLLSYGHRSPTAAEHENYRASKAFSHLEIEEDNGDGLTSIVQFNTLEISDEGADYWDFSFRPDFDDQADEAQFLKKMRGSLRIDKHSGNLVSMEIRNRGSLRPMIGAKIKRLHLRFDFGDAAPDGPWVLRGLEVQVSGSALVFARFDELERYLFSDFDYVGSSGD